MVVERMRAAIADAWTFAQADELARGICRALADEVLTDQDERDLQGLLEALHARRAEIRDRAGGKRAAGADEPRRRSIFRERVYQPIADLPASRKRARQLAASGPLPPGLAVPFSVSHLAALRIVADEVAQTGTCRLHVEEIAARAGISRRSVQYALRAAEAEGLLVAKERPRKGEPHMTNVIHLTSPEWIAWVEKGKRPGPNGKVANFGRDAQSFAPHGQGSNPEPLAPRPTCRAAGGKRADSERADRVGSALQEAERGEAVAMSPDHATVRSSERSGRYTESPGRGLNLDGRLAPSVVLAPPRLPLEACWGRERHRPFPQARESSEWAEPQCPATRRSGRRTSPRPRRHRSAPDGHEQPWRRPT